MSERIKRTALLTAEETATAGRNAEAVRCFRLLCFAGQRLRYLFDQRLRKDGLTTQQGFLLTLVRALERPTLGEVAAAMSVTHQNAKQIAVALERKGMIALVVDRHDARVRRLEPTAVGQAGWGDRNEQDFAAIGGYFSELNVKEQATLAALLARVASSLAQADPGGGSSSGD